MKKEQKGKKRKSRGSDRRKLRWIIIYSGHIHEAFQFIVTALTVTCVCRSMPDLTISSVSSSLNIESKFRRTYGAKQMVYGN